MSSRYFSLYIGIQIHVLSICFLNSVHASKIRCETNCSNQSYRDKTRFVLNFLLTIKTSCILNLLRIFLIFLSPRNQNLKKKERLGSKLGSQIKRSKFNKLLISDVSAHWLRINGVGLIPSAIRKKVSDRSSLYISSGVGFATSSILEVTAHWLKLFFSF